LAPPVAPKEGIIKLSMVPALRKLRFKSILDYIVRPYLKKKENNKSTCLANMRS
jgi:hypothetical protein